MDVSCTMWYCELLLSAEDVQPVNVRVAFVSDTGVVFSWQLPDVTMLESVVFSLSYTQQASSVTTTITVPQQQGRTQGETVSGLDSGGFYYFSISAMYQLLTSIAVNISQQTERKLNMVRVRWTCLELLEHS